MRIKNNQERPCDAGTARHPRKLSFTCQLFFLKPVYYQKRVTLTVVLEVIGAWHGNLIQKRAEVGRYVALYERENKQGQRTPRAETDTNATSAFRQLLCKVGVAGGLQEV